LGKFVQKFSPQSNLLIKLIFDHFSDLF
jgi:hypothetical protein